MVAALLIGTAAAALSQVLPTAVGGAMVVLTLVAIGAFTSWPLWPTAALYNVGPAVALVARAVTGSGGIGWIPLVIPVLVLFAWLALGVGRLMGDLRRSVAAGEPGHDGSGLFATKERRGAFLAVLAILIVGGGGSCQQWTGSRADRLAREREAEIRLALADLDPADLSNPFAIGGPGVPGGPYRLIERGPDGLRAEAQVRYFVSTRCVEVRLPTGGELVTTITDC